MKKTLHIMCAAALAVSVLSCGKEGPASRTAETGGTVSISVQGSIEDLTPADGVKASAGSVVRVKWETGDAVYVYDGATNLGKLKVTLKEGDDRFAFLTNDGTVNAPQSGTTKLTLIYASGADSAPEVSNGKISIDLGTQDDADFPFVLYGTLDYESGTVAIEDKFVPFEFATSALKVNCFGLGGSDIAEASLSGVNTKCELSISKNGAPTVAGTTPGTITRSGEGVFSSKTADGRAAFVMGVVATAATGAGDRKLFVTMNGGCGYESAFSGSALESATSFNVVYNFVLAYRPTAYVVIEADYDNNPATANTSLKWAKDNLAITPSGRREYNGTGHVIGDYFQWGTYEGFCGNSQDSDHGLLIYKGFSNKFCGDTNDSFEFKSDKTFVEAKAPYSQGSYYTKYTKGDYVEGGGDGRNVLESSDDAAAIILGGNWRMPKKEEFEAMKAATYWAWDNTDKGYYVYIPNPAGDAGKVNNGTGTSYNKSNALLYFPLAGGGTESSLKYEDSDGSYWSSTIDIKFVNNANRLYFKSDNVTPSNSNRRFHGRQIRPVSD